MTNYIAERAPIHCGDIYWVELKKGIGSVQGKMRPCLIVQNDVGNRHSPTTIVIPLTSQKKKLNVERGGDNKIQL